MTSLPLGCQRAQRLASETRSNNAMIEEPDSTDGEKVTWILNFGS